MPHRQWLKFRVRSAHFTPSHIHALMLRVWFSATLPSTSCCHLKNQEPNADVAFIHQTREYSACKFLCPCWKKQTNKVKSHSKHHISATHRFDLERLYERIIPHAMIQIKCVNTTQQLAEILRKNHAQETDGHNWRCWWTSWLTPHSLKVIFQFLLRLPVFSFSTQVNVPQNLSLGHWVRENQR